MKISKRSASSPGQQGDVELAGRLDADGVIGDHLVEAQRARGHVAGIVGRDRGTRRFDECQAIASRFRRSRQPISTPSIICRPAGSITESSLYHRRL
jgi:hypothetical protein